MMHPLVYRPCISTPLTTALSVFGIMMKVIAGCHISLADSGHSVASPASSPLLTSKLLHSCATGIDVVVVENLRVPVVTSFISAVPPFHIELVQLTS